MEPLRHTGIGLNKLGCGVKKIIRQQGIRKDQRFIKLVDQKGATIYHEGNLFLCPELIPLGGEKLESDISAWLLRLDRGGSGKLDADVGSPGVGVFCPKSNLDGDAGGEYGMEASIAK